MKQLLFLLIAFACSLNGMRNQASLNKQLLCSIAHSSLAKLQELIEAGADVNAKDDDFTPLHQAAAYGHIDKAKILLKAGAHVNATRSDFKITPLHEALSHGHIDMLRVLLEAGANVHALGYCGEAPLYTACQKSLIDAVEVLLQAGADINDANRSRSKEIFTYVSMFGNFDYPLLEQYKELKAMININPKEALEKSVELGYSALVKEALQKVGLNSQELKHYNNLLQTLYRQNSNYIYKAIGKMFRDYSIRHTCLQILLTGALPKDQVSFLAKAYNLYTQLFARWLQEQEHPQESRACITPLPKDVAELIATYAQER